MPSLEDAMSDSANVTTGNQRNGDRCGDAEGTSDNKKDHNPHPAESWQSMGSRQCVAWRRAQERVATHGANNIGKSPLHQPRGNRGNAVPVDSLSVQGGDLKDQLNARKEQGSQATQEATLTAENKALAERMASLAKQVRSRTNNFEKVIRQVTEVINIDTKTYTPQDHPFTPEITKVPLPDKYKAPPILPYDHFKKIKEHFETM